MGAVSFYVDPFVAARIAKFAYGTSVRIHYQPSNLEHVNREHKSVLNPLGQRLIPGCFETMLSRVCDPSFFVNHPRQSHRVTGY